MDQPPVVSIVTPSFNQGGFIADTIASVLEQAGDFFLDYIIVDGGSTDGTLDIIRDQQARLHPASEWTALRGLRFLQRSPEAPWVRCRGVSLRWVSEPDQGQSDAINKGFKMAVGDTLAFLNSDDTYYPDALSRVVSAPWSHADFLYGEGMWVSKEGEELLPYPTFPPTRQNFHYQCTLCQPAVFFTRTTYERLGPFSQDYHVAFDFEYWMRALDKGMRFRHLDALLATSRFYVENKSMAQSERRRGELTALRDRYGPQPLTFLDKVKMIKAKYIVHRRTVRAANRLQALIESGVRYSFR